MFKVTKLLQVRWSIFKTVGLSKIYLWGSLVNFENKRWNTKLSSPWERNPKFLWWRVKGIVVEFKIPLFFNLKSSMEMTLLETSNRWFQYYDPFEFKIFVLDCNFKSVVSEFELRLILKSLVNVEIDVLNS